MARKRRGRGKGSISRRADGLRNASSSLGEIPGVKRSR